LASSLESKIETPRKTSALRIVAASCIVVAGFCLVVGILFFGLSDKSAANRDFIEYWAAGQQIIHGANPYDGAAILRLERAQEFDGNKAKITFSPPVAFFLVLPLGFVSAKAGVILWTLALLASLAISIWILWILNGRPSSRLHLLGYLFAPVLACLMAGQLGTFLLLAVVLFLYFHQSQPYLAGAALLPCALKPHLFLPFAIVLLLWAIDRKADRILAGFQLFSYTLFRYPCVVSVFPDDELNGSSGSVCAHPERDIPSSRRSQCRVVAIPSRGLRLRLGNLVFLVAAQLLELDGSGFVAAPCLGGVYSLCLVQR
jgi:hypothetical protein